MKSVVENGIRKNSFEWSKQRIGHRVQKLLETAFIVGSSEIEHDLKDDHPVAQTKKIVDKLTRPVNQTKSRKINLF